MVEKKESAEKSSVEEKESAGRVSLEKKEATGKIRTKTNQTKPSPIIEDKEWQKKLLPFMMATLIALTVFFIGASYLEFRYFKTRLDRQSNQDELKAILDSADNKFPAQDNKGQSIEYTKWRAMVWLEKESIEQRYTHSNTLILSRMWTRYIGFLVGMIMAIVGAVFILGKLRESESQLITEANLFKVSVTSASPGIILAALGTILLLTTVIVTTDVKVSDGSLYLPKISNNKTSDSFAPPANYTFDDSSDNSNKGDQTNNGNTSKTGKNDEKREK